jgi:hypothetical protein
VRKTKRDSARILAKLRHRGPGAGRFVIWQRAQSSLVAEAAVNDTYRWRDSGIDAHAE